MPIDQTIFIGATAVTAAGVLGVLWAKNVIRPDSFPAGKSGRDVRGVPVPVWLLCALLVLLSQSVGAAFMHQINPDALGGANSLERKALIGAGAYVAAIGIGALMVYLLIPRVGPKGGLGFRWEDVGRGIIATVLAAPILMLVAWLSEQAATIIGGKAPGKIGHEGLQTILDNRDSPWGWLIGICAVAGAPVMEELVYRAFLQSCLLGALERAWPAIIGTAAIFTAMHTLGGGVAAHSLPTIFVLGLAMGIAFERTRAIAVPITMHMLFNLANIVVAVIVH